LVKRKNSDVTAIYKDGSALSTKGKLGAQTQNSQKIQETRLFDSGKVFKTKTDGRL
jgi:hypothetical protein